VIVGAVLPHARAYADGLFRLAEGAGIEWCLDAPPDEVSEILRHSHVAYLAPTWGIHERRGTLLACAANGIPVVARVDWETPAFLRDYLRAANSPREALAVIDELSNPDRLAEQSARSVALSSLFSWDLIAERYTAALRAAAFRHARAGAHEERVEAGDPAPRASDGGVRVRQ
jgi:glycosyltransferase involved in cell wall biosynthesis